MENNNILIVNIMNFTLNQQILIYKDGVCILTMDTPIEEMTNVIYSLCRNYNINNINFCGNKEFCSKYVSELQNKYDFKNINIVSR